LVHDGDDPTKVYQIDPNKRLGKGGFGEVFQATDLRTGEVCFALCCFVINMIVVLISVLISLFVVTQQVAIKKMQINQKNKMEYLLIETDLHARVSQVIHYYSIMIIYLLTLSLLQHEHVVQFIDAFLLRDALEFW
jgi:serine/threonine protein kinase